MTRSPEPRPRRAFTTLLAVLTVGWLASACVTETTGDLPVEEASDEVKASALVDLAAGYIERDDMGSAKRMLERAQGLDGDNWQVYDLLGQIHEREGDYDLAERSYKRAVRFAPSGTRAGINYGVFLYDQGRFDDAVKAFEKASDDPGSPYRAVAFESLGLAALADEDPTLARNAFGRAVMLDGRRPRSLLELAELSYAEADYLEAGSYYQRYRSLARQSPRSLLLGIRIARAMEDENAEASFALQLRNMFPDSAEYRTYQDLTGEG